MPLPLLASSFFLPRCNSILIFHILHARADQPLQFRAIDVKKFRESEVKHARLAMLAFLGMFVQELAHPLFDTGGKDLGPAIYHFQAATKYFPLMPALLLVNIGILEGNNIYGTPSVLSLLSCVSVTHNENVNAACLLSSA